MGAGRRIYEVAERASGMGFDRVDEVGDRTNKGQTDGVYGTGYTEGSLARVGLWDEMRGPEVEIGSDKQWTGWKNSRK